MSKDKLSLIEGIILYFENTKQTNWGKKQLVSKIKDIHIEYLKKQRKQD